MRIIRRRCLFCVPTQSGDVDNEVRNNYDSDIHVWAVIRLYITQISRKDAVEPLLAISFSQLKSRVQYLIGTRVDVGLIY